MLPPGQKLSRFCGASYGLQLQACLGVGQALAGLSRSRQSRDLRVSGHCEDQAKPLQESKRKGARGKIMDHDASNLHSLSGDPRDLGVACFGNATAFGVALQEITKCQRAIFNVYGCLTKER